MDSSHSFLHCTPSSPAALLFVCVLGPPSKKGKRAVDLSAAHIARRKRGGQLATGRTRLKPPAMPADARKTCTERSTECLKPDPCAENRNTSRLSTDERGTPCPACGATKTSRRSATKVGFEIVKEQDLAKRLQPVGGLAEDGKTATGATHILVTYSRLGLGLPVRAQLMSTKCCSINGRLFDERWKTLDFNSDAI
nr:hypothetical protein Iba_chr05eCG14320 [Ipomoea batatas]